MRLLAAATFLLVAATAHAQKDPHWVGGRNTIIQLFEWKFSDIAAECERFLAPSGYAGVQTSPVNEYVALPDQGRPWWERYQPMSYKIISRSGDEAAFADMVRRCNNVGVRIYVDVVFNHMTGNHDNPVGYGGSTANTYQEEYYGVPYGPDDFHQPLCAINDYSNGTEVRDCELVGLHDLNQTRPYVREKIIGYLDSLVDHGVAGFRVDIAKHMWQDDLLYIFGHVKNLNTDHGFASGARAFVYQEVSDYGYATDAVRSKDYTSIGVVTEFRYGKELSNCFRGNNPIKYLQNWGTPWALLPSTDALAFINNHDTERDSSILTYKEAKLYKMANVFMLAWPYGITRITSGFAFTDYDQGPPADGNGNILDVTINSDTTCGNGWVCEHRWRQIFNMIKFKNTVEGTGVNNWWDNGDKQIAFSRGGSGFAAFNDQYNTDFKQTLQTGLSQGTYCDLISGSKYDGQCNGKKVEVGSDGKAYIEILDSEDDGALAISIDSKL